MSYAGAEICANACFPIFLIVVFAIGLSKFERFVEGVIEKREQGRAEKQSENELSEQE